jgi:predicted ATPase
MSASIFISYSRVDDSFAHRITAALQAVGFEVWFDQGTLAVGDQWRERIVSGIRECSAFVVVLSESSVRSPNVLKEVNLAEHHDKPIFPLLLGDTDIPDGLAYQLAGIQYLGFEAGGDEAAFERLVDSLRTKGIEASLGRFGDGAGPASLYGRESQLEQLDGWLDEALAGRGRTCFVVGKTGSGKTALVEEFLRRATGRHPELVAAVGASNARTGVGDPYLPFREILALLLGDLDDSASSLSLSPKNTTRLRDQVTTAAAALVDYGPDLLGALIPASHLVRILERQSGVDTDLVARVEEHAAAASAAPQFEREQLQSQFGRFLRALAERSPLLLVVEDLQWADEGSIELLFHLWRVLARSPVLVVGTYRRDDVALGRVGERHPLDPVLKEIRIGDGEVQVDLDDLSDDAVRAFVDAVVDAEPNDLGRGFRRALVEHTGGNALFVTELVATMKASGELVADPDGRWQAAPEIDWERLPGRIEAVIEERVARLSGDLLEILQVASVEGSTFTAELVARIQNRESKELIHSLSRDLDRRHGLIEGSGVEKRSRGWLSRYRFIQTHFQRYIYAQLDDRERMIFHSEFAQLLEEAYEGDVETIAPQLAWHFEQAGEDEKAAHYLTQSGQRALRLSAYKEGLDLLDRALALLVELPETAERDRMELDLQVPRSAAIKAVKGWVSPETMAAYDRALTLSRKLDDRGGRAPVLFGTWAVKLMQLRLDEAAEIGAESLELGRSLDDEAIQSQAHVALSNTHFWRGDFAEAATHGERVAELYDPADHPRHLLRYGYDPMALGQMFTILSRSARGEIAAAVDGHRAMMRLAEDWSHPFSLAISVQASAWHHYHLGQPAAALTQAERLYTMSRGHQFPFYVGMALLFRGWGIAHQVSPVEGIPQIREGYETWIAASGDVICHSMYRHMLAQAHVVAGDLGAALEAVDAGLELAAERGELCYEAELHRTRADVLVAGPIKDRTGAAASYRQAIRVARRQGARWFELRAALGLARLNGVEGQAEAVAALEPLVAEIGPGVELEEVTGARELLAAAGVPTRSGA